MNHLRKIVQYSRQLSSQSRQVQRILFVKYEDSRDNYPRPKQEMMFITEEQYKDFGAGITWDNIFMLSSDNNSKVKDILLSKIGLKKNLFVPFMNEYDYNVDNIEINDVKYYESSEHDHGTK